MASVLAHLLGTMPIEAAVGRGMYQLATARAPGEKAFKENPPAATGTRGVKSPIMVPTAPVDVTIPFDVFKNIYPATGAWPFGVPGKPSYKSEKDEERNRKYTNLWAFKHDASKPHIVTDVTCRVREVGFANHQVLDSLTWGLETAGKMEPKVQVVRDDGVVLDLPLTSDYLYLRLGTNAGLLNQNPACASWRYPLEVIVDKGLVVAFAYELDENDKVVPYNPGSSDKGHAAIAEWVKNAKSKAPPYDHRSDRWIDRAIQGDFMPLPLDKNAILPQLRAAAKETKTVAVAPPRILVTLSLTCCKERADFEPIGIVGMARMYPHVTVRASFKTRAIHASARFERPAKTTIHADAGEAPKGACCGALDKIGSILVSDANYGDKYFTTSLPIGPDMYFLPFWGGLFGYFIADPDKAKDGKGKSLKGQALRVVDRSKPDRLVTKCGKRELAGSPQTLEVLYKVRYQGEFDNIHLAPRLRQTAKKLVRFDGASLVDVEFDPQQMKTNDIVMAPFCSHDCFHLHWRWSTVADTKWSKGFGANGPYSVGGTPLIPLHHDMDLTVHGPNVFTLTEHAHPTTSSLEDDTLIIQALREETFFYMGAAYAQGIASWIDAAKVKFRMSMTWEPAVFIAADGTFLGSFEDPPTTYWNLRYYLGKDADGKPEAVEYIQMSAAEVDRARRS